MKGRALHTTDLFVFREQDQNPGAATLLRANLAASLVGFNCGVEIGQVSVILLATLSLDAIRQYGWAPVFRRWVSAAAAVTGFVWFVQRVWGTWRRMVPPAVPAA